MNIMHTLQYLPEIQPNLVRITLTILMVDLGTQSLYLGYISTLGQYSVYIYSILIFLFMLLFCEVFNNLDEYCLDNKDILD